MKPDMSSDQQPIKKNRSKRASSSSSEEDVKSSDEELKENERKSFINKVEAIAMNYKRQ